MIRRDFMKRLSALAALPILPALLRRDPKPAAVTYTYGNFRLVPPRDPSLPPKVYYFRAPAGWVPPNA